MSKNSIVNPEARSLYTALMRELFELEQNEKSKEAYDSIRDKIDRIIELEPNNEDAYFWAIACDTYASIAILGKDDNAAQYSIEMGTQAEWLHNHSHTMDSDELISLYEGMTTALLKLDRLNEAEKYCKLGLENQPNSTLLIQWQKYLNKHNPSSVGSTGSEKKSGCFIATAVRRWLQRLDVQTLFIEPGCPRQNDYVESFSGKLRDELLNQEIFYTLEEAKC